MMTNTAPGLNRHFAAEYYGFISKRLWSDAKEEARVKIIKDCDFEAFASDINPEAVKIAEETVKRAGMKDFVKVFRKDALEIKTGGRRGTVVCNPPYGERLLTVRESENLYRSMGKHFSTLDSWQIYILTSNDRFESFYGRRADKVRKLYNGMIPCYYYQFFKKPDKK